jgi:hypothetical protein
MSKLVGVTPSWSGALALWAGSDHYSLAQAFRREQFFLPIDRVSTVYQIHARPLIGLGGGAKFALEYSSEMRDCFVTLEYLPEELEARDRVAITPPGAALLFFPPLMAGADCSAAAFFHSLFHDGDALGAGPLGRACFA